MFAGWLFITIGNLFLLAGLLIWKLKFVGLIASYDPAKVTDKNALARWFGCTMGTTGLITISIGITNINYNSDRVETFSFIAVMFLSMFTGVIALVGYQKYSR